MYLSCTLCWYGCLSHTLEVLGKLALDTGIVGTSLIFWKKKFIYCLHFSFEFLLLMYRQYIANSQKCYVLKVSLVELNFFADARPSPL